VVPVRKGAVTKNAASDPNDNVRKIEQKFEDKKRQNLDITLFDCFSLSDMLQLLQKSQLLRELLGFHSTGDCEKA
jgi:capsid portal protein